jgi:hypothetical protein
LNVAQGAYARVVLNAGPKVEIGENSDITLSKDSIQMTSGNIAFSGNGQKPVRVHVGAYEVTANGQAKGTLAFVGSSVFNIRVLEGNVSVRNTATKQSFMVAKGNQKLVSLSGDSNQSGALLASAVPTAIPAAPSMPAPRRQLSGGAKTAVLVASVLGSAAAIAILMTKNDDTDAEAAARLRKTFGAQTLSNAAATASAASDAASAVSAASSSASTAIAAAATSATFTAAERTALVNRANTLNSAAQASRTQISTLQLQLANLQDQLANASPGTVAAIETQISTVLANVNSEVGNLNNLISQLNQLVNDARAEVPNIVPIPTIQAVPPAQAASPSIP